MGRIRSRTMENRSRAEQRIHMRFNKVFRVIVGSELYGDCPGVARNISSGGMMIEMVDPVPIGAVVTVKFEIPDSIGEISVKGEVKHHYCFNFVQSHDGEPASSRGIGLRFVEFLQDIDPPLRQRIDSSRILH